MIIKPFKLRSNIHKTTIMPIRLAKWLKNHGHAARLAGLTAQGVSAESLSISIGPQASPRGVLVVTFKALHLVESMPWSS